MIVFSGFRTAWRFAGSPTRMPSFVKATTDGNIFPPYALPSALGMIFGVPPSMYAASEFVVPRSIPMILAICLTFAVDDDLRGSHHAVVVAVPFTHDFLHNAFFLIFVPDPLNAVHEVRVDREAPGGDLLESRLPQRLHAVPPQHPAAVTRPAT